mmetsp:Transcript_23562/g.52188  ORF Transcript_23562/g.52188 Transcript_23562/m.52188 type:complete len:779 (-) Transcript_23562:88-2424(-)
MLFFHGSWTIAWAAVLALGAEGLRRPEASASPSGDDYSTLGQQIAKLRQQLLAARDSHAEALRAQRADYMQNLTLQKEQIEGAEATNAALKSELDALFESHSALNRRARELKTLGEMGRDDLRTFQQNLTTASDFIKKALSESDDTDAPEMRVLDQLNKEKELQSQRMAHSQRLEEISGALSFLAVGSQVAHGKKSAVEPADSLAMLKTDFFELGLQQAEVESTLKKAFLAEYEQGAARYAKLMEQQSSMKSSKAVALKLKEQLQAAVRHLETTQEHLHNQGLAIRQFAETLSGGASAKKSEATSLLQSATSMAAMGPALRAQDVSYGPNLLDVYRVDTSATTDAKKPVVLCFHSFEGNKLSIASTAKEMARFGLVAVAVSSNYVGAHLHSGISEKDSKALLAWVKDNIDQWGGDPDQLFLYGVSCGGSVATKMALTESGPFLGAIIVSGSHLDNVPYVEKYKGTMPKFLVYHARDDPMVPFLNAEGLVGALEKKGADITADYYDTCGHHIRGQPACGPDYLLTMKNFLSRFSGLENLKEEVNTTKDDIIPPRLVAKAKGTARRLRPAYIKNKDIEYMENFKLDVVSYDDRKSTDAALKPVMLIFHSINSTKEKMSYVSNAMASLGFVSVAVAWEEGGLPLHREATERCVASLREWVSTKVHEYGGDSQHLSLYGVSAGGSVATKLALSGAGPFEDVVVVSGAHEDNFPFIEDFQGKMPRWEIFQDTEDMMVNYKTAEAMVQLLKKKGASVELSMFSGYGHKIPPVHIMDKLLSLRRQ